MNAAPSRMDVTTADINAVADNAVADNAVADNAVADNADPLETGSTTQLINTRVKQRIATNFSRAAGSYDQAATLQKRVAARTMQGLPARIVADDLPTGHRIIDLGTGTGLHSLTLAERYDNATVIGMDLAMGMLQFARQNISHSRVNWCLGDIESIPFQSGTADLIYSSLAIQWCSFEKVLCEVGRVLKPGGTFVFSTLADGSLRELDIAWCKAGAQKRVNRFASFTAHKQCLQGSVFYPQALSLTCETVCYPDVITLLRSLKSLGVNTVLADRGGLLTRSKLIALQRAYELWRQPEGIPLSYQVIYGVLQKAAEPVSQ